MAAPALDAGVLTERLRTADAPARRSGPCVLFVNSGILGHRAVATLMKQATARHPGFRAEHIDLTENLTIPDRIVRRLLSLRLAPSTGAAANLDL